MQPGRNAYCWIRGTAGWSQSPEGESSRNDGVPDSLIAFDDDDGASASTATTTVHAHRPDQWTPMPEIGDVPLCD